MFKQSTYTLALAAIMLASPMAHAADEMPAAEKAAAQINFEALDVDGDGYIRKNEFPTKTSTGLDMTDFDRLDVNKDRKLSPEEIQQQNESESNFLDKITE